MDDDVLEIDEELALSRRGLLVTDGLAASGLSVLSDPTAAAFGATSATKIKVAVDTGSFWSVVTPGRELAELEHELAALRADAS
jgi:hypothetical protein